MTFSSYMEINILIDMCLIVVLTFVVLPRAPKLYVAMLLLNLAQYAVLIPNDPTHQEPVRFSWSSETPAPAAIPDALEEQRRLPASNPLELAGRARTAFSTVSQAMGGAGVPNPTTPANERPSHLDSRPPTRYSSSTPSASRQVTLEWQSLMLAAIRDPHAMWLGMRVFWLAAAFMLFLQRPLFGMVSACSNLIPVPFLVTAGPYLYGYFNNQDVVQRANAAMDDPETLREFAIQFATSNGLAVLLLAVMILGSVALMQRRRRLKALKRMKHLESFLDSNRYRARLNGTEYAFSIDDNILMINGLRFNLDAMQPDSDDSHKWYIRPHNELVFIPKEDAQAAAGGPRKPRYSYKRKT